MSERASQPSRRSVVGATRRLGEQTAFYGQALVSTPDAIRRYPTMVLRQIANMGIGTGALAVIGGTVVIIGFLTLSTGALIAVQGYNTLSNVGIEALTGFLGAFLNVRFIAPATAGVALAATIGAGATAQIGAMRINEEIDAIESMAIRPIPYLVSSRLVASLVVVVPLYILGLVGTYVATDVLITTFYGQSSGTYDHYFRTFVSTRDVMLSGVKVVVLTTLVTLIHCYHGYTASGGPAGVGVAVGRAVRTSIVVINIVDLLLSMFIWGATTTVRLAG